MAGCRNAVSSEMGRLKASMADPVTSIQEELHRRGGEENDHEKRTQRYRKMTTTSKVLDENPSREETMNLKSEPAEEDPAEPSISCAKCNFTALANKKNPIHRLIFRHVVKCCNIRAFTCSACFQSASNQDDAVRHSRRKCNGAAIVVQDR